MTREGVTDDLYVVMDRAISRRQKYSVLISKSEETMLAEELKTLENIKVDLGDNNRRNTIKLACDATHKLIQELPRPPQSVDAELCLQKSQKNLSDIMHFLELRNKNRRR